MTALFDQIKTIAAAGAAAYEPAVYTQTQVDGAVRLMSLRILTLQTALKELVEAVEVKDADDLPRDEMEAIFSDAMSRAKQAARG